VIARVAGFFCLKKSLDFDRKNDPKDRTEFWTGTYTGCVSGLLRFASSVASLVSSFRFQVSGFGFWVLGFGFRVSGLGF